MKRFYCINCGIDLITHTGAFVAGVEKSTFNANWYLCRRCFERLNQTFKPFTKELESHKDFPVYTKFFEGKERVKA